MASIREQIETDLRRNGSELLELRRLWLYPPALFSVRLSNPNVVYRAVAKTVHGEIISRVYAYDFLGWGEDARSGLKRHVQSGWVSTD